MKKVCERIHLKDVLHAMILYPILLGLYIAISMVIIIVQPVYQTYLKMKGEDVMKYSMADLLVDKKLRFKKNG